MYCLLFKGEKFIKVKEAMWPNFRPEKSYRLAGIASRLNLGFWIRAKVISV